MRGETEMNTFQNGSAVRETIDQTFEALKFSGITTEDFVKFQQAREVY